MVKVCQLLQVTTLLIGQVWIWKSYLFTEVHHKGVEYKDVEFNDY